MTGSNIRRNTRSSGRKSRRSLHRRRTIRGVNHNTDYEQDRLVYSRQKRRRHSRRRSKKRSSKKSRYSLRRRRSSRR